MSWLVVYMNGQVFHVHCSREMVDFNEIAGTCFIYEFDLKLQNKLHGPMHYTICFTCVFNGHEINTLL